MNPSQNNRASIMRDGEESERKAGNTNGLQITFEDEVSVPVAEDGTPSIDPPPPLSPPLQGKGTSNKQNVSFPDLINVPEKPSKAKTASKSSKPEQATVPGADLQQRINSKQLLAQEEDDDEDDEADEDDFLGEKVHLKSTQKSKVFDEFRTHKQIDAETAETGSQHSRQSSNSSFSFNAVVGQYIVIFWESGFMRGVRRVAGTARFGLGSAMVAVLVLNILIMVAGNKIPGMELESIRIYNGVHIGANILGHLFVIAIVEFCRSMHKSITAVKLNTKGTDLVDLTTNWYWDNVPGSFLRQLLFVFSILVDIFLVIATYNFSFTRVDSFLESSACIPAIYPPLITPNENLATILQGQVDFALIYAYALPLKDGAIGGWSSWPNANPASSFSVSNHGSIYAINVNCFAEVASDNKDATQDATFVVLEKSKVFGNFYEGQVNIFFPTGSVLSDLDTGFGVNQTCTFIIGFGQGNVEFQFNSDEWEMVVYATLRSLKTDDPKTPHLTTYNSANYYFEEFARNLTDPYGLSSNFKTLAEVMFAPDQAYVSSQGAPFCNLMSWGTAPDDGLYHIDMTPQGFAAGLAVLAHYMSFQYDGSQTATCDYFGDMGAGFINDDGVYPIGYEADLVYSSLTCPVLFANGIRANIGMILGSSPDQTFDSLPEDILKKCGDSAIFYGVKRESIDQGVFQLAFGSKRDIISIHKMLKMQKRRAKTQARRHAATNAVPVERPAQQLQ